MNPGDLVILSNQGLSVRLIPDSHPSPLKDAKEFPPGTLAMILETGDVSRNGPGMETWARVLVGEIMGYVWLAECQEIREEW